MTTRDRIVLGVVTVAAVLAGFFFLVLKPKTQELAAAQDRQVKAQQRIDVALADLRDSERARAAFKRDRATLALLGKAVPADDDVPSLLYQVHKAARQAGIDFSSVTVGEGAGGGAPGATGAATAGPPGTTAGTNGLAVLPLKVTFAGEFFRLDRFLGLLHGFARSRDGALDVSGRLLTVDGVTLKPDESGLTAEVVANAYVSPAAEDAPGATPGAAGAAPAGAGAAPAPTGAGAGATTAPSTGAVN